jgi:hypothetical protein
VDPPERRAGVVHQDVDRPQRARLGRHPLDLIGRRQVAADRDAAPAERDDLGRHRLSPLSVAVVVDRHVSAPPSQRPRDRRPDVATPTGDQRRALLELHAWVQGRGMRNEK